LGSDGFALRVRWTHVYGSATGLLDAFRTMPRGVALLALAACARANQPAAPQTARHVVDRAGRVWDAARAF